MLHWLKWFMEPPSVYLVNFSLPLQLPYYLTHLNSSTSSKLILELYNRSHATCNQQNFSHSRWPLHSYPCVCPSRCYPQASPTTLWWALPCSQTNSKCFTNGRNNTISIDRLISIRSILRTMYCNLNILSHPVALIHLPPTPAPPVLVMFISSHNV